MKFKHLLLSFFMILFFTSCGYKPSSYYVKKEIGEKVFVNLLIDLKDPRNAVLIKDAMNEILVHRLGSKLVYDRDLADTVMDIKLSSVKLQVLQNDESGYNKLYKAVVTIAVDYKNKFKNNKESFKVQGDYDFSIDSGTTITDTRRFEAIKNAASEALEDVISTIAVKSFKTK